MANDFDQAIRQVKDRSDIIDVIGAQVKLRKTGPNYLGLCPFHGEKTPSFNVSQTNQFFHCFGCGKSGDVIKFVQEFENLDFRDALEKLARSANVILPESSGGGSSEERKKMRDEKEQIYELMDKACTFFQQQLRTVAATKALSYAKNRGLDDKAMAQFRLGYAPDSWDAITKWANQYGYSDDLLAKAGLTKQNEKGSVYDRFRDRLLFPIMDISGRVIAFSARTLDKDSKMAKYINSPETPVFHKSNVLYGIHLAHNNVKEAGNFIICEGQLDVIACHRAGLNQAIASQGTAFTEQHVSMIKRYASAVKLCFDADGAGKKATLKSMDLLLPQGILPEVVMLDEGSDPDTVLKEHGAEALQEKFAQGISFLDFIIKAKTEEFANDSNSKVKIAEFSLNLLSKLPGVLMGDWHLQLAEKLGLDKEAISDQLRYLVNGQRESSQKKQYQKAEKKFQTNQQEVPEENYQRPISYQKQTTRSIAEQELIILALTCENYAHLVLDATHELDHDTSPSNAALNLILSHTDAGDWINAEKDLSQHFYDVYALIHPKLTMKTYDPEADKALELEDINQVISDCLQKIQRGLLEARYAELILQMHDPAQADRKADTFHELSRLMIQMKKA